MKKQKLRGMTAWALTACLLTPNFVFAGTWHSEGTNWYYRNSAGINQTGWLMDADNWYYLKPDGTMNTGWVQDERQDWYYLNTKTEGIEGCMRSGWFWKDGKWYFFNTVHDGFYGRAITGQWQWIDGYCYLFDEHGMMYANGITPDGYTVNADGQWTVDGVVQYIPGKGIITKQTANDTSSGSRRQRSGGGGGGSSGNSGNSGNTGGNTDDSGNTGKPQTDSTIIVQCVVKETGEILAQKEVTGEIGEHFVVQQPVFPGYKLLEEQPQQTVTFEKEIKTVVIDYRVQKENEESDQRVVVPDDFKAISPETEEQKEIVSQMRDQIFDYNVDEDGNAELAVMNDNPLLQYINQGVYKENDIIYIDMCDAFPTGFIMTYYQHDDNYSGEYDGYNPNECEIIRGKKTDFFELFQEGTYIDYHPTAENNEIQLKQIFAWTIDGEEDTQENSLEISRIQKDNAFGLSDPATISFSYSKQFKRDNADSGNGQDSAGNTESGSEQNSTENTKSGDGQNSTENTESGDGQNNSENTGSENDQDSTEKKEFPLDFSVEGMATIKSLDFSMDYSLGQFKGINVSVDLSESLDVGMGLSYEGDISDFLIEKLFKNTSISKRDNEIQFKLLGINTNLKGVDIDNSYIFAAWGYEIGTPLSIKPIKVDNLFASLPGDEEEVKIPNITQLHWNPVIFVPVMLDLEAVGEISADISGHMEWNQHFGADIDENGTAEEDEDEPAPGFDGSLGGQISGNVDLYAGPAAGLGISVLNITPVMGKVTPIAIDANINGNAEVTILPKLDADASGKVTANFMSQAIAMINLVGEVNSDFKLFGADGSKNISINLSKEYPLFDITWLSLEFPKDPTALTLSRNTSVTAINMAGIDISKNFAGYDSSTGKVKTQIGTDGYTFQCPGYIKETVNEKDKMYAVTKLEAKEKECVGLELSKAGCLEELSLDAVSIKNLDVSKNTKLKTVTINNCIALETFTGNGKAFPTQLKWYKDKEKTQSVTSAKDFAAGETIYSENYGLSEIKYVGYTLRLKENTSVIAVDKFGRNISSQYEGYADGEVKVVKSGNNYSFQCPQYIKTQSGDYLKITGVDISSSEKCKKLDLSKAPEVQSVYLDSEELQTLVTTPDNQIERMTIKRSNHPFSFDFTQCPSLYYLYSSDVTWDNGIDLSKNNKLEELTLNNIELKSLKLPEKSSLTKLTLEDCREIDELDLSKQGDSLKQLKLQGCHEINGLDLSKQSQLTYLMLEGCDNIKLLDISGCTSLKQLSHVAISEIKYTMFKGNGQVKTPFGTWYADEDKTELVTTVNYDNYDGYSLIFSEDYEKPTSRKIKQSPDKENISTPSNAKRIPKNE